MPPSRPRRPRRSTRRKRLRRFDCPVCDQEVFFENTRCLRCGTELAFSWPQRTMVVPEHRCLNPVCNWALPPGADQLCESCVLTRKRPAQPDEDYAEAEAAKRRLLFELGELGLWPIQGPDLSFELLEGAMTGHADGVITLDLQEADDVHRERMRDQLREPYRTVLGHFRHEIGHYYWPILTEDALDEVRALFGDERADYQESLERHYADGPPDDWAEEHVSAYATMHPWEDWAETFAHFLHIRDVMQTATAWGLAPGAEAPMTELVDRWLPLSYALNGINRSLGHGDLYPYVLTPKVIEKLALIDRLASPR